MKIDELSIDHNALKLIEENTTDTWGVEPDSHINKEVIMYINGVLDLAKKMKEVLRA